MYNDVERTTSLWQKPSMGSSVRLDGLPEQALGLASCARSHMDGTGEKTASHFAMSHHPISLVMECSHDVHAL